MLDRLTDISAERGWPVTVVTRAGEIAGQTAALPVRTVINPESELGISTSIRRALFSLPRDGFPAAFFVADQPYTSKQTIVCFLDAFLQSGRSVGCVAHRGKTGNPTVFSCQLFPELLALEGDTGGKRVLLRHMEDCFLYDVSDAHELIDIDTPL